MCYSTAMKAVEIALTQDERVMLQSWVRAAKDRAASPLAGTCDTGAGEGAEQRGRGAALSYANRHGEQMAGSLCPVARGWAGGCSAQREASDL